MWHEVYNLLTYPVWVVLSTLRPLLNREFRERLGEVGTSEAEIVYWFHCASVGELSAISGLVSEIRKNEPDSLVVVTTMTRTGKERAAELFPEASSYFAPLDSPPFVRAALRRIRPSVLFVVETELWPNLVMLTAGSGCEVVVVNGRLTSKSLGRYLAFRPLFIRALRRVSWFFVQTDDDRMRFERLGAKSRGISVTGMMKSDLSMPSICAHSLREEFSLPDGKKILVAGSIRTEEEKDLLRALARVREKDSSAYLVLAPRHVQRARNIAALAEEMGMKVRFRSDGEHYFDEHLLILDTMGELTRIYGAADVCFVGGSLKPYGGHNLLEAAMWGVPVLFGRFTDNCREEARELLERGGGMRVSASEDLASTIAHLLEDDVLRVEMGVKAREVVLRRLGVSRAIYESLCVKGILGGQDAG
ncbi:MAG: 3-deoxy-D-manno-octulosonic acid transferase [bacterium]